MTEKLGSVLRMKPMPSAAVFSAFGFVHKIATFEKAAGFQALILFTDAETASAARNALDGRSIPRYLLPEHVTSCHLRISYCAHRFKYQIPVTSQQAHSDKSRDYTIPDSGVLSAPQPPAVPAAVASWQSAPQAPSMYGAQAISAGEIPTWDPNMMGVQPDFSTVARTYTEQTYALSSLSPYPTSGRHHATAELRQPP